MRRRGSGGRGRPRRAVQPPALDDQKKKDVQAGKRVPVHESTTKHARGSGVRGSQVGGIVL